MADNAPMLSNGDTVLPTSISVPIFNASLSFKQSNIFNFLF